MQDRDAIIKKASATQNRAANPYHSVWVSANAGTGKTRVLTNRILRLLIDGAQASDILAVTYTRAAASEMRDRLYGTLAKWAVIDESALEKALKDIGIEEPDSPQLERARRLFATLLDSPIAIKIETVHAFAQSVLRRFPVEARLMPYFEIASEVERNALEGEAIGAVMRSQNREVMAKLALLSQRYDEYSFIDLLKSILKNDLLLTSPPKEKIFAALGCEDALPHPIDWQEKYLDKIVSDTDEDALNKAREILREGSKTDAERGDKILGWLKQDKAKRKTNFKAYSLAFLTTQGEIRKSLATKEIAESHSEVLDILEKEASRVYTAGQYLHGLNSAIQSEALLVVAIEMKEQYRLAKGRMNLLDYADLIKHSADLLKSDGGMSWVRYKLDKGINHVLIDEAQDTSPPQWDIVDTLTEEFFASEEEAGEPLPRSLFAVGDNKQSIFSFQGAAPGLFRDKSEAYKTIATQASKPFEAIDLDTSFRSADVVLKVVDTVTGGLDGVGEFPIHEVSRVGASGFVQVLDIISPEDENEKPEEILADKITDLLESWIGVRDLPSKNRKVKAGDILILLRKRDSFHTLLDRKIRLKGLPLAGADRVKLNEDIATMDLIALGKAVLLPDDDLTLAAVLKSPLFGLDEEQLFRLANIRERGRDSIFQRLAALSGEDKAIAEAHERFVGWLALAEKLSPYDFYRQVLTTEIRQAFAERLGNHVRDILAEFLEAGRQYEAIHPASLLGFLSFMEESEAEITRESNNRDDDEIRMMTVHGAKGLESPIVILPDTLRSAQKRDLLIGLEHEGMELPIVSASDRIAENREVREAKDRAKALAMEEENRLLYVALTRAEDGLLIGGYHSSRRRVEDDSWYEKISEAIADLNPQELTDEDGHGYRLLESPQEAEPKTDDSFKETIETEIALPKWVGELPKEELPPPPPLSGSQLGEDSAPSSPLGSERHLAMQRGTLAHRLLEILPSLKGEVRARAQARICVASRLPDEITAPLCKEVLALIDEPSLAPLFSDEARAEVPISGVIGKHEIHGIIDRLHISDECITIIDFKTGSPPKKDEPPASNYVAQLAAYRAILEQIYQEREIKAGLIYTEDASVRWLSADALDKSLHALALDD